MPDRGVRIDSGSIFYPRGGSAQVIRYLLSELQHSHGVENHLFAGSLGQEGSASFAPRFYDGITCHPADYSQSMADAEAGRDPLVSVTPLCPAFQDRPGSPERLFCSVSPPLADNLIRFWTRHFQRHGLAAADVVHLHHLTPLHGAAARVRPAAPTVTTLHGPELMMLRGARERTRLSTALGRTTSALATELDRPQADRRRVVDRITTRHGLDENNRHLLENGQWQSWRYADRWAAAMRAYAATTTCLVVTSRHDEEQANDLLAGSAPPAIRVANGVDTNVFVPATHSPEQTLRDLSRWLVEQPRGWVPGGREGSISYSLEDVARLRRDNGELRPLLMFVGRFLTFKRLSLLIRAFAEIRRTTDTDPALLVWGGFPGEWQDEHPYDTARRLDVLHDVYFLGWRDHRELALGLTHADLMVAPAVDEPFGLVYLEAMACGVPVIASASGGPLDIIRPHGDRATGWLARPDNVSDLTRVMVEALSSATERRRRGTNAARHTRQAHSWAAVAARYVEIYDEARTRATPRLVVAGR